MRVRRAAAVAALCLAALPAGGAAAAVPAGAFAEAYGLQVDTTLLDGNVPVAVGPLAPVASSCPPATGPKSDEVLGPVGDPAVAKADVLRTASATDCVSGTSLATAQTINLDALGAAAPIAIHADAVTTRSTTSCTTEPTGSTVFTNLTVGGAPVPLPTEVAPNTDLLPQVFGPLGLRVILNEQHPAATGRGLVVNGLHIIAANGGTLPVGGTIVRGDVVVSHAASGVVCPGGPGASNGTLPKPDISFAKAATPTTVRPGDTVTYTTTTRNTSSAPCEVIRFIEHVAPPFELVSTAGPLGTAYDTPPPARTDGGVDAVLRPTGVTIAPGASLTQSFVVKVKPDAAPGTYYDSLEIYCGLNGDFVSGPLAPVTVTGPPAGQDDGQGAPITVVSPGQSRLPKTGATPLVALAGVALLGGAALLRRRVGR